MAVVAETLSGRALFQEVEESAERRRTYPAAVVDDEAGGVVLNHDRRVLCNLAHPRVALTQQAVHQALTKQHQQRHLTNASKLCIR